MKKKVLRVLMLFVITSILGSCENNLMLTMPEGPKGDKGDPGASAFDLWKQLYGKDPNTSIEDFFASFKGADGKDAPVPFIGDNGNWWIGDTDTGKPARGANGATPVIGNNGNWFIDGKDTGFPARGADGKDGETPVIGANGNWFINGKDTGLPARGADGTNGSSPVIGANGNWFIDGQDTGVRAEGVSAYELWKNSVDDKKMTNKDGSPYTGGNTWTDFTKWLQGGDMSVLHQYWLKQGNQGDINAFLESLFDCHCDGISIIVIAQNECIEVKPDGTLAKTYNATLKLGGKAGAKFHVTGDGIDMTGSIPAGQTETSFTIPRTSEDQRLLINCTLPDAADQISKTATIAALKYIKLADGTPISVTKVDGEEKDIVTISFATAPDEMFIGGVSVYTSASGVVDGTDWVVSNSGKTFTKTYNRAATAQEFNVKVTSLEGDCTTLNKLFTIPQLTPVSVTTLAARVFDECNLTLTLTGDPGMTVVAKYGNPEKTETLRETSPGVYSTTAVQRAYSAMDITVTASKDGSGNAVRTIRADGNLILTTPFTVTWTDLASVSPRVVATSNPTNYAYVEGVFTNKLNKSIDLEITRPTSMPNERFPWIEGNAGKGESTRIITVAPGAQMTIIFQRDVTPTFATGSYNITASTISQCVKYTASVKNIANQRDFTHGLKKITNQADVPNYSGGGGSLPFDKDYTKPTIRTGYTLFEVVVNDAQPGTYVQFLIGSGTGTKSIWGAGKVTDSNGTLKILVEIPDDEIKYADGNKAEFKFYDKPLGGKELHSKTITALAIPK